MTELYLIRHVQAVGNCYHMLQGHWDGGVTRDGEKQRQLLEKRFAGEKIDAVYSSDLYRAMYTAGAVADPRGLRIQPVKELREIDIGPWQNCFLADIEYETPEPAAAFLRGDTGWHLDGAETFPQVAERAFGALEKIALAHPGEIVAAVSHGITCRSVLQKITGVEDALQLPISGNTAVTKLIYDNGGFTVEYFNDMSHLGPLPQKKWGEGGSLRAESLDPRKEASWYEHCYASAWREIHGSLRDYSPELYLEAASLHHRKNSGSVLKMYCGDTAAGIVDLDPEKGSDRGIGWISLLYLEEDFRGRGLGDQLLGRAVAFYEGLGRTALGLNVSEHNGRGLAFYKKWGFEVTGIRTNSLGKLYRMEKELKK